MRIEFDFSFDLRWREKGNYESIIGALKSLMLEEHDFGKTAECLNPQGIEIGKPLNKSRPK